MASLNSFFFDHGIRLVDNLNARQSRQSKRSAWDAVYEMVRMIPPGRVMTYGQIALYLEPLSARAVGWAMRSCPADVPWQRVVNAKGGCSTDRMPHMPTGLQQALLEREGIEFSKQGTLDLKKYRWFPERH